MQGSIENQCTTELDSYLVFDCFTTLCSLILSVHCMQGSIENQCTTELDYPG